MDILLDDSLQNDTQTNFVASNDDKYDYPIEKYVLMFSHIYVKSNQRVRVILHMDSYR